MPTTYKSISRSSITILESNGCRCDDWSKIKVSDAFSPQHLRNVTLCGDVEIGATGRRFTDKDGITRRAGIYDTMLNDCTIGDNVYVSNTGIISKYTIAEETFIENCGKIICTGDATFGHGVRVKTINENGGREIPISPDLSAQIAYIMAMYRHRPDVVNALEKMTESVKVQSSRGSIGVGNFISNCGEIVNILTSVNVTINGASSLKNGSILGTEATSTEVGTNVYAEDFIFAEGSFLDTGAVIRKCFVGQNTRIDNNFSATDCLFFANCEMGGGEASSVFAGPYCVSHHKSSLLIAGYFLFFNAGSGTNQSNHLFKAGAVHEGIHERGVKFASNAYVMQPSREGAYTIVIGRHTSHHNTTSFPYSILDEEEGRSYIIPAANLVSYGTLRDITKWPHRDGRTSEKRDVINFEEYNPYVGQKVLEALKCCESMLSREDVAVHSYQRARIKTPLLRRGARLYKMFLEALIGYLLDRPATEARYADEHWIDMAGMFAPKSEVEKLLDDIETGAVGSIAEVEELISDIHHKYNEYSYSWALRTLGKQLGRTPSSDDISAAIATGREAHEKLTALREDDLQKDCTGETIMTGYGIDATDKAELQSDFRAVRGIGI